MRYLLLRKLHYFLNLQRRNLKENSQLSFSPLTFEAEGLAPVRMVHVLLDLRLEAVFTIWKEGHAHIRIALAGEEVRHRKIAGLQETHD